MQMAVAAAVGQPSPLGATLRDGGVNFALFSRNATGVRLLLFDDAKDAQPSRVVDLTRSGHVWHTFLPDVGAGQLYGYQVFGPWHVKGGHRFDARRLLVDPYARALTGKCDEKWLLKSLAGRPPKGEYSGLPDNCAFVPKSIVVDNAFDWGSDAPPRTPLADSIIYEAHLKGLSAHSSSGARQPGTYLGVIDRIPYLRELGITAVEFLPVHHCQDEPAVLLRGQHNFWGYMTLGYFAPDRRFAAGSEPDAPVREFKSMVAAMHAAGIEVILDVVYNHTCEAGVDGPTLCFRGIDNASYYDILPDGRNCDYTGCGNSLRFDNPDVVRMVMDSLRYWVEEMHVDGFRFDLATTLGRVNGVYTPDAPLFVALHQDPVLCNVKLIAEPWDVGEGGYQVGRFPVDWAEWNGRFRDSVRRFMKGDRDTALEVSLRVMGSPDLYQYREGRAPFHSVNFITCHDGFTLRDLVTYYQKHNEANGFDNTDGSDGNDSWNWGVEGETDDVSIQRIRLKMMKNFMAVLLLSEGVPMLLAGDEIMRTQRGNNNAFVQDTELGWIDWRTNPDQEAFRRYVQRLIGWERHYPQLRRRTFFLGEPEQPDVTWVDAALNPVAWDAEVRSMGCLIKNTHDLFLIFNAHWEEAPFSLPAEPNRPWYRILDTSLSSGEDLPEPGQLGPVVDGSYTAAPRSIVMLARP
ncbi:MAG: glycogen debranching protein GlgX [Candidatus Xenobia bacterium]